MAQPSEECRRRGLRQRTLKGARIVFNNRHSSITCTVRNFSSHGALLVLPTVVGVPDNFELYIDGEPSCRPSRVAWKREGRIAVEFE